MFTIVGRSYTGSNLSVTGFWLPRRLPFFVARSAEPSWPEETGVGYIRPRALRPSAKAIHEGIVPDDMSEEIVSKKLPCLDKEWGDFVTWHMKHQKMNRRKLACKIGCDPSYVSLLCRGHIPSRDITTAIGQAFGLVQETLLMAGYVKLKDRQAMLDALVTANRKRLPHALRLVVSNLANLPEERQVKAAGVLRLIVRNEL